MLAEDCRCRLGLRIDVLLVFMLILFFIFCDGSAQYTKLSAHHHLFTGTVRYTFCNISWWPCITICTTAKRQRQDNYRYQTSPTVCNRTLNAIYFLNLSPINAKLTLLSYSYMSVHHGQRCSSSDFWRHFCLSRLQCTSDLLLLMRCV